MNRLIRCVFFSSLLMIADQLVYAQDNDLSTIYQIQLAAYQGEVDWDRFKNLKDVGLVNTQSIAFSPENEGINDNLAHVFVGRYLGMQTVEAVKKLLINKGFKDLLIEKDDYFLNHATGKYLRYTIQLGAFKKLDMEQFANMSQSENLHIVYEKNSFRVLYGFFNSEKMAELALEVLKTEGFEGKVKTFR
ncbi:MAG: SPOR domain-containing protein [Microscillaceae bacterium]|nr:SPOR domain-containing protein [Microscillaceae bacterium]